MLKVNALFLVFVLLLIFVFFGETFSRYFNSLLNDSDLPLAPWKIAINDQKVTSSGEFMVPTNIVIDKTKSTDACINTKRTGEKLVPGCVGYFDIKIDPTGTGVELEYEIDFHPSSLPGGMIFTNYSTDGGVTTHGFPDTYKIKDTINLENGNLLNANDILNYRIFFNYQDNDLLNTTYPDPNNPYGVMVTIKFEQSL